MVISGVVVLLHEVVVTIGLIELDKKEWDLLIEQMTRPRTNIPSLPPCVRIGGPLCLGGGTSKVD